MATTTTTTTSTSSSTSVSTKTSVSTNVRKIESNKLVSVRVIPYTRAQKIYFKATGLRPNCRHFAFFDQVAVDSWCREETFTTVAVDPTEYGNQYNRATQHPEGSSQLFSDAQGTIEGSFFLPNTDQIRFRTGEREFRLLDISVYNPANAISTAFNIFASNGNMNYYADVYLRTTTILTTRTVTTTVTTTTTNTITNTTTPVTEEGDSTIQSYDVDGDGVGDYNSYSDAINDGWPSSQIDLVNDYAHGDGAGTYDPDTDSKSDDDDSVICTELHRQGLIPTRIYRADLIYYRNHSNEEQVRAYHSWAVPVVRLMKKSKLATRIIQPFGKAWAYEMAYRVNKYPESNLLGRIIVDTLHPMHKLIGKIAFTEKKHNSVEGLGE